jgi:hypothetical protein
VGDKYGSEYVNKLYGMVSRHLRVPHRFICITDNTSGLHWEIICQAPRDPTLEGWWQKMTLYNPPTGTDAALTIYLDLDTIICDDIGFLADYGGCLAMLRDFYRPKTSWASGILLLRPTMLRSIWRKFDQDRQGWMGHGGDQQATEAILRARSWVPDLLQDLFPGKIRSYKVHCQNHLPTGTALVCFHGRPRPHEVNAPWIKEHWRE